MIEASTPLMRQYQSIKKRYPHALLLFRLGDFYELFYEDAMVASAELQITLTSRNRERGEPIPMCGVPFHAAETYIARLLRAGYKIAVCDQMEQPGPGKHLVRREVVRVITPGTATDLQRPRTQGEQFPGRRRSRRPRASPSAWPIVDRLHRRISRHRICRCPAPRRSCATNCNCSARAKSCLPRQPDLFAPLAPSRSNGTAERSRSRPSKRASKNGSSAATTASACFAEQFGVQGLEGFGLAGHPQAICAAGALLHYLRENSPQTNAQSNAKPTRSGR